MLNEKIILNLKFTSFLFLVIINIVFILIFDKLNKLNYIKVYL